MAVYGHTDLQQYKLEAQLSLLPEVAQAMEYDSSQFDIADLLYFFQSLGNARKLLWVRFAPLVSLCLSCQLPMPSASGRQFVCGGQPAAQATVWEVFKKRPADEVYVCL